jgi:hypothetical protein
MEFPDVNPETYEYDSLPTIRCILRRSIQASVADICKTRHNAQLRPVVEGLLESLGELEESSNYRPFLHQFTKLHASVDNDTALDMAQAGIDAVHDTLEYRLDAQTEVACKDIFVLTKSLPKLGTKELWGTNAPDIDYQYGITSPTNPNITLYGTDAVEQINTWYQYGVLETSASVLAKTTVTTSNLSSLLSRKKFVVLGCTSELGPTRPLLQIPGTTVLGVARGGNKLDALIEYVSNRIPDDSCFKYPKSDPTYPNGGADLIVQGPQIAQWILDQTSESDELVIVTVAGSTNPQENLLLAASMDLIVQRVMRQRPANTILWSYTSPTTCMVLPPTAATTSLQRRQGRPSYEHWASSLTLGKWLEPSLTPDPTNHDYILLNGLLSSQGLDYAMAKLIQQWRCMLTQYRDHQHVSAPFCPITRTDSMCSNPTIGSMLDGMHHFEPLLAFHSSTASSLMCSIYLAHLQLMNRQVPDLDESPFSMFWDGAAHSGVWTCPYTLESISTINWTLGKLAYYPKGYVPPSSVYVKPQQDEEGNDIDEHGNKIEKPVIDPDVLLTLTDSQAGLPMPDSVRERLDFL